MGSAVKRSVGARPFDVLIEELTHRRRAHQTVEGCGRKLAIVIVDAFQADNHVALRFVIADALDETASRCVATLKRLEIDGASVFYVNGLRLRPRDMSKSRKQNWHKIFIPKHYRFSTLHTKRG
jgi:hypothetical protein